jgi:hypothetical protein
VNEQQKPAHEFPVNAQPKGRPGRRRKAPKPTTEDDWAAKAELTAQNLAKADELERQARQLRGMSDALPKRDQEIRVKVTDWQRWALQKFAESLGAKGYKSLFYREVCGAEWLIDFALSMLPEIRRKAGCIIDYRLAEGFHHDTLANTHAVRAYHEMEKFLVKSGGDDNSEQASA